MNIYSHAAQEQKVNNIQTRLSLDYTLHMIQTHKWLTLSIF